MMLSKIDKYIFFAPIKKKQPRTKYTREKNFEVTSVAGIFATRETSRGMKTARK